MSNSSSTNYVLLTRLADECAAKPAAEPAAAALQQLGDSRILRQVGGMGGMGIVYEAG